MASDVLLLGRVTFEGFAQAWPSMENEFADKFNGMPKYVVSTTLRDPDWNNSTVIDHDIVGAVSKLKRDCDGDILVNGSVQLVQALMEAHLVDEIRLMVYPILLGAGRRLFAETGEEVALRLVDSRTAGETVILILQPVAADGAGPDEGA